MLLQTWQEVFIRAIQDISAGIIGYFFYTIDYRKFTKSNEKI